jgi:hypothetical protein
VAREWWIEKGAFQYRCVESNLDLLGWNADGKGATHVIEYAAYEKLKAENEALRAELNRVIDIAHGDSDENAQLKDKLAIAREALEAAEAAIAVFGVTAYGQYNPKCSSLLIVKSALEKMK